MRVPRLRRRRSLTPAEVYSHLYPRPRLGVTVVPRACPTTKPTTTTKRERP